MAPRTSRKAHKQLKKSKAPKWEAVSYAHVQNLQAMVENDALWTQNDVSDSLRALEAALSKLQGVQRPAPADDPVFPRRDQSHFDAFETWLREKHAIELRETHMRIARVADDEDNVTLVATADISAGAHLVSVPNKAMISTAQLAHMGVAPVLRVAPELARDPSVLLALVLLANATKADSEFKPYIDVLPRSFTTPFWNFKAMLVLAMRPSPAFHRTVNTIRALVRRYARVYTALRQLNLDALPVTQFSWARYLWAVSIVMTRQNEIPTEPRALALVPVWDLCNHAQGTHSTSVALLPGSGEVFVECNAMRDFKQGEQVTIFYGTRPNSELLLFSGFIQENNPFDVASIPLPLSRNDPLHPLKLRVLEKAKVAVFPQSEPGHNAPVQQWVAKIQANSDGSIGDDALAVARVICMHKEALVDFLRSKAALPLKPSLDDHPDGVEARARALIVDVTNKLLLMYDAHMGDAVTNGDGASPTTLLERQLKLVGSMLVEERRLLERVVAVHQR